MIVTLYIGDWPALVKGIASVKHIASVSAARDIYYYERYNSVVKALNCEY